MTSKAIVRSAEDIDEKALSYAEIKALAAGNPLIIEKTELDTQVAKLKLLKQNYLSQIYKLEDMIAKYYPEEIKRIEDTITAVEKDIEIVTTKTNLENEEKFSPMKLKDKMYYVKEEAGKQILEICKNKENAELEDIGEYRGLKMALQIDTFSSTFQLKLRNNSIYNVNLGSDIHGNITRIDNVISDMEKELQKQKEKLENTKNQFEIAKVDSKIPFDKEEELKEKSAKLDKINILLKLDDKTDDNIVDDDIENNEIKTENQENKKGQDYDRDYNR